MKLRAYLLIIFSLTYLLCLSQDIAPFDRSAYYASMASDKLTMVDEMLLKIEKSQFSTKNAFMGALEMKKAGLVGGINNKINIFKAGHAKLEKEIQLHPSNAEFRLLRLMIQENAPAILNYNNKKQEDKQEIVKAYKSMSPTLKNIILDYSKHSKVLLSSDF